MPEYSDPSRPELSRNAFEALGVYSTAEELALAEIQEQLLGADLEGECVERKLLTYQLAAVRAFLGEYCPSDEKPIDNNLGSWLSDERKALSATHSVNNVDLDPLWIIKERAAIARWRIVGIDPSTVPLNERNAMQNIWNEAVDAVRAANLAQLALERAQLHADNQLAKISNGQDIDGFYERYSELSRRMQRLERNSSAPAAGWGTGDGDGSR